MITGLNFYTVKMVGCIEQEILVAAKNSSDALKKAEEIAASAKWGEDPHAVSTTKLSGKKSFLSI